MTKKSATRKGVEPQEGKSKPPVVAPAPKPAIDWDAIERAYRAGVLTLREIATQNGCTHGAIRKRAIRDGWSRDLSARVREAVSTGLVSGPVSTEKSVSERMNEREIVEAAASQVITLVREHRQDIKRQRGLAERLLAQLEMTAEDRDEIEDEIFAETAPADGDPASARAAKHNKRTAMLRAVALPQNAATLKDLSVVLKTLIALEREAFNITLAPEEPKSPEDAAEKAKITPQLQAVLDKIAKTAVAK